MNEGQENFNENLDTTVNNVDNTGLNEVETPFINPEPTPVVDPTPIEEPTPVEEPKPMMEVHPIDAPIPEPAVVPEPVVNTSSSVSSNSNKKGNKGLIVVIIILVALLLGAVGYILYSNGIFGEKDTEPKTIEKEETKEKETVKEQVLTSDFDPEAYYMKNGNTRIVDLEEHELGSIKINEVDYKVSYKQINCETNKSIEACKQWYDALTVISFSKDSQVVGTFYTDGGIKKIAVLDDRYVLVDSGWRGDHAPYYNGPLTILDSKDSFKEDKEAPKGFNGGYNLMENGDIVPNSYVDRTTGYVDQNHYTYGMCASNKTTPDSDYIEYKVTVKDGKFTEEKTFEKENVFCSAQRQ